MESSKKGGFIKCTGIVGDVAIFLFVMVVCSIALSASGNAFIIRPPLEEDVIETSCGDNNTDGKKILVVYDTEHGSTSTIAKTISDVLCEQGAQIELLLASNAVAEDLSAYDAVIVGSPIYYGPWLPGIMSFLNQNKDILSGMPVAYFVVSTTIKEDTLEEQETVRRVFVEPVLEKIPEIQPVDNIGLFGGTFKFKELYPIEWLLMKLFKFPEGDWRDFDKVSAWAEEVIDLL
jgi:menaquinone-dependent protoporphyrinogen oxidase